ncbi:MAG: metallophosphoesterase, partial [Pirellulales bacterium]
LAGNELPWFPPAADMSTANSRGDDSQLLRIVLAHSPDQFVWARQHDADLMLAGHTHGGQIRLPVIGAIVSPSRYGTRYACGAFFEPPTVMHVSRGISGTVPVRHNCPPELTKLVLVNPTGSAPLKSSDLG